jgi:hypothetical protein
MPDNAMELNSKTAWQKDDLKKFRDLEESAMHDPSRTTLPRVSCGLSHISKKILQTFSLRKSCWQGFSPF